MGCVLAHPPTLRYAISIWRIRASNDDMDNVAIIKNIYEELLKTGSTQAFVDAFAEDGVMQLTIPRDTPLGGPFRGKAELLRYLALSEEMNEILGLEITDLIAHGDKVILIGHEKLRIRANDTIFESEWVAVFDMVDGKITRLQLIEDCSELTIACRGLG
jgi:ketosteroid isomerase-like protein